MNLIRMQWVDAYLSDDGYLMDELEDCVLLPNITFSSIAEAEAYVEDNDLRITVLDFKGG